MSGIPYNKLQTVEVTAKTDNGETVVIETLHYAYVIPCRDCRYLVDDGSVWVCDGFCANIGFNDGTPPNGFCAWAERRKP